MTTDLFLNIEQSKHLQELGLDMSDANYGLEQVTKEGRYSPTSMKYVRFWQDRIECLKNVVPTYSLQEILEKLPPRIDLYTLQLGTYDKCIGYYRDARLGGFGSYNVPYTLWEEGGEEKPIIESAYKLLCWVIKHGHLRLNKDEEQL